jgi:hypothetical protein
LARAASAVGRSPLRKAAAAICQSLALAVDPAVAGTGTGIRGGATLSASFESREDNGDGAAERSDAAGVGSTSVGSSLSAGFRAARIGA